MTWDSNASTPQGDAAPRAVVSFTVAGQQFGIDITRVEDVFVVQRITPVPLAPAQVVGVLNLRGKVMTALCLRRVLGFAGERNADRPMAIGVTRLSEAYGLLIDSVGDVVTLDERNHEPVPAHVRARWSHFACRLHKLDHGLLVELDADALTCLDGEARAA